MLLKDGIVALQQQGASLDLIRELVAICRRGCKHSDDRVVSRGDDRQFNLITKTSPIQPPRRLCSEGNPPTNCIRFSKPRTLNSLSTSRATSESTHLPTSKQINLVINGKGGVGKSFFASNFVQYLRDCGIAHCAIDSDHENAILKRFIAVATPDVAKTLNFLRSGFGAARLLSSKVQRLCSPFPEMQPSRVAFPSPHLRKLRRAVHSDNA